MFFCLLLFVFLPFLPLFSFFFFFLSLRVIISSFRYCTCISVLILDFVLVTLPVLISTTGLASLLFSRLFLSLFFSRPCSCFRFHLYSCSWRFLCSYSFRHPCPCVRYLLHISLEFLSVTAPGHPGTVSF